MTATSWTTGSIQDTDANFRVWGKELSDALQAIGGLTKTGDSGQINWTTVTRHGGGGDAGYEVYYLNDSLHSTAPIYFRIGYGSNFNNTAPRLNITVGTGSNGSGTLTGTCLSTAHVCNGNAASTATAYPSYLCVTTGFLGLAWKVDNAAVWGGFFSICRSCDADGTPNADGCIIHWGQNGTQSMRFAATAAARAYDSAGNNGMAIGNVSTGLTSGTQYQVYQMWMDIPDVRPVFGFAGIFTADFSVGTTFSLALVGTTARTYVALHNIATGAAFIKGATGNKTAAMLYE